MLTDLQIRLMKVRRDVAVMSLRIYKEIRQVRSTNIPGHGLTSEDERRLVVNRLRERAHGASMIDVMDRTLTLGVGNCAEKCNICFLAISANPRLSQFQHAVTLAVVNEYDHTIVLISDLPVEDGWTIRLDCLDRGTCVVDGHMEDWHFPNLSHVEAATHGLWERPRHDQQWIERARLQNAFISRNTARVEKAWPHC